MNLKRTIATALCGLVLASLVIATPPASARGHHHGRRPSSAHSGGFDYYLLALSWSPEFCAEKAADSHDRQCGSQRHFAFVVHGLWPQDETGGYPQHCSSTGHLEDATIAGMLDIMPSAQLVEHEWQAHGSCSGLRPDVYFGRIRQVFSAVKIPDRYRHPEREFSVTAAEVRNELHSATPSLSTDGIAVLCKGRFLAEVRVCVAKDDLSFRPCGKGVHDECRGEVVVRPLR